MPKRVCGGTESTKTEIGTAAHPRLNVSYT